MWNSCPMRVASLRERLLAVAVDAAAVILGMAVVVGLGVVGVIAYMRVRGRADQDDADDDEDEAEPDRDEDEDEVEDEADQDGAEDGEAVRPTGLSGDGDDWYDRQRRVQEFLQSPLLRASLLGVSAGLAVANRNWRSPGFRVVGLRRVDARTRGPIRVRSGLIRVHFDQARQAATRPLFRSRALRERDRNRIAACGWQVAGPILSELLLAIPIRDGRTVYDRLTETIVVNDQGPALPL
jgi:hypothetical protein